MTTNETTVPTYAEREATAERTAIARCICKTGAFPSPKDIADERTRMTWDAVHGLKTDPEVSRATAAAWLTAHGLSVPALETK